MNNVNKCMEKGKSGDSNPKSKFVIYLVGTELHDDIKLLKIIQSLGFSVAGCLGSMDEITGPLINYRTPPRASNPGSGAVNPTFVSSVDKFTVPSPILTLDSGHKQQPNCRKENCSNLLSAQSSLKALRRLSASKLPGLFSLSPAPGSSPVNGTPSYLGTALGQVLPHSPRGSSPTVGTKALLAPPSANPRIPEEIPLYVLSDFSGSFFDKMQRERFGRRLVGPTFFYNLARCCHTYDIPEVRHPLFCLSMQGLTLCFSRFTDALQLTNLVCLAQYMGATVRKKFNGPKVTHLVSLAAQGDKYRAAANLGKPIMSHEWVSYCWKHRFEADFVATKEGTIAKYKLKPFVGCFLSFVGFTADEKRHMEEQAIANGAKVVECEDPQATHLVVDEQSVRPENLTLKQPSSLVVVKGEWFWVSIQLDFCAHENLYLLTPPPQQHLLAESSLTHTPSSNSTVSIGGGYPPGQGINENPTANGVSSLAGATSFILSKVRERSYSTSILDSSENSILFQAGLVESPVIVPSDLSSGLNYSQCHSTRHMTAVEILNTEMNYVTCLELIKNLYHKALEEMACDRVREPLLDGTEIKAIFGNLPPIHEVHKHMLVDLSSVVKSWNDDSSIGNVVLAHVDGLLKAYPAFINFFHDSKNTLKLCDQTKPKFHAFLKICQNKPESGRQNLEDLLIRPVQRLPSLILLLSDLLKHTPEGCEDRSALNEAINAVKSVLDQINEGKRKTETQLHMFEIVNDIENCPPDLLSSQRTFIFRANVHGLTNEPSVRGRHLALFLFNDCLEICKRRNTSSKLAAPGFYLTSFLNPDRPNVHNLATASSSTLARSGSAPNPAALNYVKSFRALSADNTYNTRTGREVLKETCREEPNIAMIQESTQKLSISHVGGTTGVNMMPVQSGRSSNKNYKHVELLHLSHIKIIGDIVDNQDFTNAFAIICSHSYSRDGRLLLFSVEDEIMQKNFIIEALHKNTINTLCLSNVRNIMQAIHPDQISISSPINLSNTNGTIAKAFKNAKKILTRKVSRAFSFNRTTPFRLKRTVSTMSSLTGAALNEVITFEGYDLQNSTPSDNRSFSNFGASKASLEPYFNGENNLIQEDVASNQSSNSQAVSPAMTKLLNSTLSSKHIIPHSPNSPECNEKRSIDTAKFRNGYTLKCDYGVKKLWKRTS